MSVLLNDSQKNLLMEHNIKTSCFYSDCGFYLPYHALGEFKLSSCGNFIEVFNPNGFEPLSFPIVQFYGYFQWFNNEK